MYLFFSISKVSVSNFYSFILHFGLLVSISLVLRRMLFPLYDSVYPRFKMFEIAKLTTLDICAFALLVS